MRTGIASFTLDWGQCPPWLFQRMVRIGRVIAMAIISEFGQKEFLKRLSDPVWFQSLGTLMAFDWNASGLTTTTTAALKESLRGMEKEVGVFVCGGKGGTSRKTPEQITNWSWVLGFDQKKADSLIYASKAAAKVDSVAIQDGFQLYHHSFIFTKSGKWAVVQQGMNMELKRARRYHWLGDSVSDFLVEPHSGISSQIFLKKALNLTDKKSGVNKKVTVELVKSEKTLLSDFKVLAASTDPQLSFKILELANIEFHHHPIEKIDFNSPRLLKNVGKIVVAKPNSFESLIMTPGVGPRTVRALSLVSELVYGAKPSYEDPARYSFTFGGKDGTPYPVDRDTYDKTLAVLERGVRVSNLAIKEKERTLRKIERMLT